MTTVADWQFDHLTLDAAPGAAAVERLAALLGLVPGHRPPFPFPGCWLYAGDQAVLHLIDDPACATPRINHIAFRTGRPLAEVMAGVEASGLPYRNVRLPDKALAQIFVRLTDALTIELDVPLVADDAPMAEYRQASDAPR